MIIDKIKSYVPASIKARIKAGYYAKNLTQRMCDLEAEKEKVSLMIGTPIHTNLGDHLITMAQLQYLSNLGYKSKVVEIPTEMYQMFRRRICKLACVDTIFINGGGWMGNLWIPEELLIQKIINDFSNKKIVILPQTVFFDKKVQPYQSLIDSANRIFAKCKDIVLCVRENNSYDFSTQHYSNVKIILVPDIVLSFYQWAPKNAHISRKTVGVCLRNDREQFESEDNKKSIIDWFEQNNYKIEQIDTMNACPVNIEDRESTVLERLALFASYDFVITDRLHGMIFSYICGTPCIAFDNKTHKVSGVYNTWLNNSRRIYPVFTKKGCNSLEDFVFSDLNFDENVCTLDKFEDLKEIIIHGKD